MSDRELLEKQAKELGVEVAADISDADLLKLLDAAKARADLEARATELGVEFAPNIGDKKLAQRVAAADKSANSRDLAITQAELGNGVAQSINGRTLSDRKSGYTVICAVAGGRRRAGRRWPGGATEVPVDEMTEDMLAQLTGDPLFKVAEPLSE